MLRRPLSPWMNELYPKGETIMPKPTPRLIIQLIDGLVTAVYGDPALTNVRVRIVDYDVENGDPSDDRLQIDKEGSVYAASWEAVAPMPSYLDLDKLFEED